MSCYSEVVLLTACYILLEPSTVAASKAALEILKQPDRVHDWIERRLCHGVLLVCKPEIRVC